MRAASILCLLAVILLPTLSLAEDDPSDTYGVTNGRSTFWDWTFQEPRFDYRFDFGEASQSGSFANGPEVGYKFGLVRGNLASGLEASLGLLTGFPNLAFPLDLGLFVSVRPRDDSPYRFDLGAASEQVFRSTTAEDRIITWSLRVKLDAEYIQRKGPTYGVSIGFRSFSENMGAYNLNYLTTVVAFSISFLNHKGLSD